MHRVPTRPLLIGQPVLLCTISREAGGAVCIVCPEYPAGLLCQNAAVLRALHCVLVLQLSTGNGGGVERGGGTAPPRSLPSGQTRASCCTICMRAMDDDLCKSIIFLREDKITRRPQPSQKSETSSKLLCN